MADMDIPDLPGFCAAEFTIDRASFAAASRSPFTGSIQTVSLLGAMWKATALYPEGNFNRRACHLISLEPSAFSDVLTDSDAAAKRPARSSLSRSFPLHAATYPPPTLTRPEVPEISPPHGVRGLALLE